MTPCYALGDAKRLIRQPACQMYDSNSVESVVKFFANKGKKSKSLTEAKNWMLKQFDALTIEDNFVEEKEITFETGEKIKTDVYAIRADGEGWYIKFYIESNMCLMSFHPLDYDIRLASGEILKKGSIV